MRYSLIQFFAGLLLSLYVPTIANAEEWDSLFPTEFSIWTPTGRAGSTTVHNGLNLKWEDQNGERWENKKDRGGVLYELVGKLTFWGVP